MKKASTCINKYNTELLKDSSTQTFYQNRHKNYKQSNHRGRLCGKRLEKIKDKICQSAEEALDTRRVNINGPNNNRPWYTPEIKEQYEQKRHAYIRCISNRTQETYESYKEVRNRTNNAIKHSKKDYWEKFSSDMALTSMAVKKRYGKC